MQIKLEEDPRFSAAAAAINIFERDDSGRRRMSETLRYGKREGRDKEKERRERRNGKSVGHR